MKRFKRLLVIVAVGLGVVVAVCSIGLMLFRAEPAWYRLPAISAEEKEAAAQRATNKLALIQNAAARARAAERAAATRAAGTTAPASRPDEPATITVSFTDEELNAFFDKWIAWNNWKASYEPYINDPVLILQDGRLILAARAKELNTVASFHLNPEVDEQGRLHLHLERVLGGNLPLPAAVLRDHRQRLSGSLRRRLPGWRAASAIDRGGTPNSGAIAATMGALLINVLDDRPAEPVLFLPLVDQGAIAVKLTEVQIENRALTLTVQPLTLVERHALLARIRDGTSTADTSGP